MALPLIFGGKVLGVLDFKVTTEYLFLPDDLSLFKLSRNVAISLRNATYFAPKV